MIAREELLDYPKFIGIRYAEQLGLSKYQFRRFVMGKDSPSVKLGDKYYLDRDRLLDYLEGQSKEKTNEST
jgi:hypothetical protein